MSSLRTSLTGAVAALSLALPSLAHAATPRTRRTPSRAAGATFQQATLSGPSRDVTISREVEALLREKEQQVVAKRQTAIALLRRFLAENVGAPEEAEAMFQLAQLLWEDAKAQFLLQMADYQSALEKCQTARARATKAREVHAKDEAELADAQVAACKSMPDQPAFRLDASQEIYKTLLSRHPDFPKIDAVHYLYGFSLRDQGQSKAALSHFQHILDHYPQSRFRPDAWMAVAEARFYEDGDFAGALAAYNEVLKYPNSPLYDIALFKTAWCMWKAGDPGAAAKRFKEVLDLGGKEYHTGKEGEKRLKELQSEALDNMVQIFTEDESKGPKDAYDFLSSVGGEKYSRRLLERLGEIFQAQARYERAIETERFLVSLDPDHVDNPVHQKRIVEDYRGMDDGPAALQELHVLVENYGPKSPWADKNKNHKAAIRQAHDTAAAMLRDVAKEFHAVAQQNEKAQKGHPDLQRYGRAADAYAYYLSHFGDDPEATEIRYLLGDIYFFKLAKYEEAGDAYLGVGRSQPVGKLHREALLNAISAYEKVRQQVMAQPAASKPATGILESDKKMGQAIDRYVELFPKDKEMSTVLYKNGELFYHYGEYDEAVKRFGLIVEKYPDDQVAGAAGDKILESLNKARDYSNVEQWARRLLKVSAFKGDADQKRLSQLVVDAAFKSGEQQAEKDPLVGAATFVRVAKEFPASARASQALFNAATLYTTGGKAEEAIDAYGRIVDQYPDAKEAPTAAWNGAKLYEQAALWDQAARLYEVVSERYPKDGHAADALYNAGLLHEHLGQTLQAITRYTQYAQRYKGRDDAGDVAFRVGVVYEQSGQKDAAARAFLDYAARYKGERTVEALTRAGAALVDAGQDRKAGEPLERALRSYKAAPSKASAHAAAHARYLEGELVFKDFERINFDPDPRKLRAALAKKSKKLEEARAVYLDVVGFGDPEWATAALYRIGEAYELFAKAMRTVPVPASLSQDEQQVYREELEKVVVVVEEKALDAYKGGWQKCLQLGVYNEFTQKLRQALGRLNDQEFPPEREARAGYRAAQGLATPPLVDEVKR